MIKVKVSESGKNHYVIQTPDGLYLQSYDTVVAYKDNGGNIYLDNRYWDHSKTTVKHVNMFLYSMMGERMDIRKAIKQGKIKLTDLN